MSEVVIKTTPADANIERAILGCCILSKESYFKALEFIHDSYFYVPSHQQIFEAVKNLYESNQPVDYMTLSIELEKRGILEIVGGFLYLSDIVSSLPSLAHLESYLNLGFEYSQRRDLIKLGSKIIDDAYSREKEFDRLIDEAEKLILAVNQKKAINNLTHIQETANKRFDRYSRIKDGEKLEDDEKVLTGYIALDGILKIYNNDFVIIGARPAQGKMENVNNMIVTPTGKIRMGDIEVGQKVCGSDGFVYDVTGVYPHGIQDSYRVYFDDYTHVDCGLDHLWEVSTRQDRKSTKKIKQTRVLTTKQLMNDIYLQDGRKNYSVRITKPVYFDTQDVTIHPYNLGVYLGDGHYTSKSSSLISNSEVDVIQKFEELLSPNDKITTLNNDHRIIRKKRNNNTSDFAQNLTDLGLKDKKSHDKFIPKNYLYNSIENRLELLKGLIDTDGFVSVNNRCYIEYSTVSYRLCNDILELVRSLGGKCTYKEKQGSYTKDNKRIIAKKYYRMYITLPNDIIPVSSKKHLAKYNPDKKYHKKYITKVELIGSAEMQCISVNSPDNLYITEGYNLTHNTTLAFNVAIGICRQNQLKNESKPVLIFSLEMSKDEIVDKMISMLSGISKYKLDEGLTNDQEWDRVQDAVIALNKTPIYVDDLASSTANQMLASARRVKAQHKEIGAIIIDYLQLAESEVNELNRVQEISKISRTCKKMAMELKTPVIALSQLSRKVEERQNKRPQLSDLRESGSLEQDANSVVFIYRDEYYNSDSTKTRIAEIIIAKQRRGPTGTIEMYFDGELSRFTSLEK